MENILLYGGRFDPIHNGHLLAARQIKEQLGFDRVLFIPTAVPAHKKVIASFGQRIFMIRRAIAHEPDFEYSACEGERNGNSYTIDTVRLFKTPTTNVHWLIGDDNVSTLHTWKDYEGLKVDCKFVVASRFNHIPVNASHLLYVKTDSIPFSSTQIKERIAKGLSVRYMVPEGVLDYINTHNLYRECQCKKNINNSLMTAVKLLNKPESTTPKPA